MTEEIPEKVVVLDAEKLDIERLVISAVVKQQDFQPVIDKAIKDFYFRTEARKAFIFIQNHVRNYRVMPSREFFALNFPDYELYTDEVTDATALYLDELRRYAQFHKINDAFIQMSTEIRKKPANVLKMIDDVHGLSNSLHIDYVPIREVDIRHNEDERLKLIEDRADPEQQEQGIRTPWPAMNEWITNGGWKPGQLITLVGALGSGKSFLIALIALEAWLQGKRVLFFTNEMTLEEIQDRVEAMYSKVPTNLISDGTVLRSLQFREQYLDGRRQISTKDNSFIICEDASSGGIDLVAAKIQQYDPECVCIDGAYLWSDTKWEQATLFSRALKKIAKDMRKAMVISWQFNREGSKKGKHKKDTNLADETDIGYNFSLGQDSDIIISCYLNDGLRERNNLILKLLKQRQGVSQKKLRIAFDHTNMSFAQIRVEEFKSPDQEKEKVIDDDDDDDDNSYKNLL